MTTLVPAILMFIGLIRIQMQHVITLPTVVWWIVYGMATAGLVLYLHVLLLLGSRVETDSVGRWLTRK
jgi:hypothetical protein